MASLYTAHGRSDPRLFFSLSEDCQYDRTLFPPFFSGESCSCLSEPVLKLCPAARHNLKLALQCATSRAERDGAPLAVICPLCPPFGCDNYHKSTSFDLLMQHIVAVHWVNGETEADRLAWDKIMVKRIPRA